MVEQEEREVKSHQEETEVVNLGVDEREKRSRSELACPSEMNW